MNCDAIERQEIAERYLLGSLSEQERDEYEEHYYACAACFEHLETLQSVKKMALAQSKSRNPRFLWLGVAAIAAATLLGVLGTPRIWHGDARRTPLVQTATASREESLRLLAHVDPPRYTPSTLRGSGEADRQFRTAMESYTRAEYAAAAQALQDTLRGNAEAPGPRFYLGICNLLLGKLDDAVAELQRAGDLGDTPYLEPARFFLAKALLAKQDFPGAERALVLTTELAGDREMEARRLLEQVRGLQQSK